MTNEKLVRAVVYKHTYKINLCDFGLTEADLVQEGSLALLKAERTFDQEDGRAKFETYASVCIRNRIFDILRSKTNQNTHAFVEAMCPDEFVSGTDYLDLALKRDILERVLVSLPEIERAIFNSYFAGHSYAEIAKIFETTPKRIDKTIQKVKQLVRS